MITVEQIENMSRAEAMEPLKKVFMSKAVSSINRPLIQACEKRINKLNRENAISVACEDIDVD